MIPEQALAAIKAALEVSPDNNLLRRHLADTLSAVGRHAEAEAEYRQLLARMPDDSDVKVALGECYYAQGKDSHALVLIDSLHMRGELEGQVAKLAARLHARAGDLDEARRAYETAVKADPRLADERLEEQLGALREHEADDDDELQEDPFPKSRGGGAKSEAGSALERPSIRFADVGGMEAVKEEIAIKIIQPMRHPELYRAYGKSVGGGILLYGPPGCGKTLLARATAGEVKANFLAIGIHDVLDMWIGSSERNMHALFEQARRRAPCVLFFDEVDALGARRGDMSNASSRTSINQFLSEFDGVSSSNAGVLVLGATNAPWHLDSAFRRPGRFERILFVPPPDAVAREEILRVHLKGKPQERLDLRRLAERTKEYSGADLKALVDQAVETRLRVAMRTGKPSPLTQDDLESALDRVQPSTREWLATARNHATYANQGGVYDDVLRYLDSR